MKSPLLVRLYRSAAVLLAGVTIAARGATLVAAFDPDLDLWFPTIEQPDRLALDVPSPELSITYRQGQAIIAWPLSANDWLLEESSELDSTHWTCVSGTFYDASVTNFSYTALPDSAAGFYRLQKRSPVAATASGLAGEWSFDEPLCEVALDSSGHQNGMLLSNVTGIGGRIGSGALSFHGRAAAGNGSQGRISNAEYRVLGSNDGPFSLSCWFSPDLLPNGWNGLFGHEGSGLGWNLTLHNSGPGTNEFVFSSLGPEPFTMIGRKLLLPGRWYKLTLAYDGTQASLYIDSDVLAQANGSVSSSSEPIVLGAGVGGYDSFTGALDELRVFTNALTREQISLVGCWHMDENSGSLISDSSIYGHHGIAASFSGWASGKESAGINLNETSLTIGNDNLDVLPPTGGSFSVSCWLYPNELSTNWTTLMSCADSNRSGWQLALHKDDSGLGRLRFWSTDSGGTLDLSAGGPLGNGTWSKLDVTFNGGIAILYINGRRVGSANGGIQASSVRLLIGATFGTVPFNGIIDELKVYSCERTQEEIGPVAKIMWESALLNTATNIVLQGFGPPGKELTFSIVDQPTKGTVFVAPGSRIATYTGGPEKGPDAFTYTVSDGEFTSQPARVILSVVEPHWLSPTGGISSPLDGSTPNRAWIAGSSEALDAIWKTNQYYDCFFYAPGEYQSTGWKFAARGTANPGCKHVGSGSEGMERTTIKLVNTWDAVNEGMIFKNVNNSFFADAFEVHNLLLDCNAANNPKYVLGEPVWIVIPLSSTGRVDSITLDWNNGQIGSNGRLPDGRYAWQFGPAKQFEVCTRVSTADGYTTNCSTITSTGRVDVVPIGVETDQIVVRLKQRAQGVDFYGISEIEVAGPAVSLPSATLSDGTESRLYSYNADYSALHLVDGNEGTVWASGGEDEVDIRIPVDTSRPINQITLSWRCQTLSGFAHLGPAGEYQIQARDPVTTAFRNVPFTRLARTASGIEVNILSTSLVTDQILIHLVNKEPGIDFYSLAEIRFQGELGPVAAKLPSAFNSLAWGDFNVLRAFDGDLSSQWACGSQGMIGAVDVTGNNLKFADLKIVGFGTKATKECFVMFIQPPPPGAPGPSSFGNVLVENCVFTEPAPDNTDGVTVVNVVGHPFRSLTNTTIRGCSVMGLRPYFPISQAFSTVDLQNCRVVDCQKAVYFEPERSFDDNVGPVLIRSNQFLNVDTGVSLLFHAGGEFDSLTMLDNEIVLTGAAGWGFGACDTCSWGPSGTMTNMVALNNLVRYPDWSPRPANIDGGFQASDIHNAIFGNNVVALGTIHSLRIRPCPSGYIPPPYQPETCEFIPPPTPPPGTYPPCLDNLSDGYRRAWFNNYGLAGDLLKVRFFSSGSDGLATRQQWR